jgi:hypothetical protein
MEEREQARKDQADRDERERKEAYKREKEEREAKEQERKDRDAERERERGEHQRAMLALMSDRQKNTSPMGQIEQLGTVIGQLRKAGLIPDKAEAKEDDPDTWPGVVAMLAKEGIKTYRDINLIKAKLLAAGIDLDDEEEEEGEGEEGGKGGKGQPQVTGAQQPQIPQGQTPPVQPAPDPNSIVERAKNVPADKQKRARRAMRYLFDNLDKTAPGDRTALIRSVVQTEGEALVPYLYAVGLRNAMTETGATQDAISKALFQMEESGQLPPDLPRN